MILSEQQIEQLEELFDDENYIHFESALKIFDALQIKYDSRWVKNKFLISFHDDQAYDRDKIIKFLKVALRVCSDSNSGYISDSGDSQNSIFVLRDTIEIFES